MFTARSESISQYSKDLKYFRFCLESRTLIKVWQNLSNLESGLHVADPSFLDCRNCNIIISYNTGTRALPDIYANNRIDISL